MASRIYVVTDTFDNSAPKLVRANTQAQALGFVTRERYHVRAAKTDDVVMHMSDGGKVEDATKFDAGEAAK